MPTPEEQIDTLKSRVDDLNVAIAQGVRQVTIGDQTTTYNTTDSLIRARDDAQEQLTKAQQRATASTAPAAGRQTQLLYAGRGCW